jgi:MFS family permease
MWVGGVVSDRLPSNSISAIATVMNTILVGLLTLMLLTDNFHLHWVIAISTLFGVSEAFLYPATLALLPQVIQQSHLGQANAWMQGSEQITNIVGPAAAGLAIGALGLTVAFALNTGLFAMGAGCIYLVQTRYKPVTVSLEPQALAAGIAEGLHYAWKHEAIRISLLLIAMINFAVLGPIVVGVAELVTARFGGDAITFGYLQSAYGIGAVLGVLVASQMQAIQQLKNPLILLACILGLGLMALGLLPTSGWPQLCLFSWELEEALSV